MLLRPPCCAESLLPYMVPEVPAKEKAARCGPVGDVLHLNFFVFKKNTETSTPKGSTKLPRSWGCSPTDAHLVQVRNHERDIQRSPPSASRHGGANTRHTSATTFNMLSKFRSVGDHPSGSPFLAAARGKIPLSLRRERTPSMLAWKKGTWLPFVLWPCEGCVE